MWISRQTEQKIDVMYDILTKTNEDGDNVFASFSKSTLQLAKALETLGQTQLRICMILERLEQKLKNN